MLKLKDCEILEITTDEDYYNGCDTCNYGSKYTRTLSFETDIKGIVILEASQMYEYIPYSYSDIMKFLLNDTIKFKEMTLKDFIISIYNEIMAKKYSFSDTVIKVRGIDFTQTEKERLNNER